MTRPDLHDAAFGLLAVAAAAIAWGSPQAPQWVRWFGVCLAVPAIALFIATAPRNNNR